MKYFAIASLLFLASGSAAHAYQVTSASVTPLSETAALYQLTFTHTIANNVAYYPIIAGRPDSPRAADETGQVGLVHRLAESAGSTGAMLSGLLLGSYEVVDGAYRVPVGETATFTYVGILRTAEPYEVLPTLRFEALRVGVAPDQATAPTRLLEPVSAQYEQLVISPESSR
jgi:hypothetical protein